MKILFFDDFKLGILKGDHVVDVSAIVADIPHLGPHDLINGLIEHFDAYRKMALDQQAELEKWRQAGVGTPSAPPRLAGE